MALVLSLCTEDGQNLAFYNPYWAEGNTPKEMPFEAVLNFVPPTSADGYLNAFFVNSIGKPGPIMAHIPLQFTIRSADSNAYPTAYVTIDTKVLDQPGGKFISGVGKGNAVTILKSNNGWSQILTYLLEAGPNIGWVPSNVLTSDTTGLPEGQLNTDVILMTGPPPNGKQRTYPENNKNITAKKGGPTYFVEKEDGWVNAVFGAGLGGWIPIKDIDFVGPSVNSAPDYIRYN